MALYHASMRVLSRSDRNTVKALAYRTGTKLYDERSGQWFDYTSKKVFHVEVMLPEEAPAWAQVLQTEVQQDRLKGLQKISEVAERAERRTDAQVYREWECALPMELTDSQNIQLARDFLQHQVCAHGMIVIASFHFDQDDETGERRPHFHALFLTRGMGVAGLLKTKQRSWNQKDFLLTLRAQWAAYANAHLQQHGHCARIDHRSYAEAGLDLTPQLKRAKGVKVYEDRLKGGLVLNRRTEEAVRREHDLKKIMIDPHWIFRILHKSQSTFMWGDVERVLARYASDPEIFHRLNEALKTSWEVVVLREDTRQTSEGATQNQFIYTTQTMIRHEISLVRSAQKMAAQQSHGTSASQVDAALARAHQRYAPYGGLSLDQVAAVRHLTRADQLSCVQGYAGSGKSTIFKVAQEVWQQAGYRVYGVALTGRAAETLKHNGIPALVLDTFLKEFEQGRCHYRKKTVLILDEAGLVDVRRLNKTVLACQKLGLKLVMAGDSAQAQPIEAGPGLRLVTGHIDSPQIQTVVRQELDWQKQATQWLGDYRTRAGLKLYLDHGHVQFVKEKVPTLEKLVSQGRHREVVQFYQMAGRISGTLWHTFEQEAEHQGKGWDDLRGFVRHHPDYPVFKKWQGLRRATAEHLVSQVAIYRDLMQQEGVDPQRFARAFIRQDAEEDRQQGQIQALIKLWGLKSPAPETQGGVWDWRGATRETLIKAWGYSQQQFEGQSHLIVTSTQKEVAQLNLLARGFRRTQGKLGTQDHWLIIKRPFRDAFNRPQETLQTKPFSKGERLIFRSHDKGLGVSNGTLGTIVSIARGQLKVRLDPQNDQPVKTVSFAAARYPYFDHGWATTILSSQSVTVDRVFQLATPDQGRNNVYVAATRHRKDLRVFVSELDSCSEATFLTQMSRSQEKLAALDYLFPEEALERFQLPPSRLKSLWGRWNNRLTTWRAFFQKTLSDPSQPTESPKGVPQETVDERERAHRLGIKASPERKARPVSPEESLSLENKMLARAASDRLYRHHQLEQTSRPIQGTLAESYLQQQGGIHGPLCPDLRFHPQSWQSSAQQSFPSLIALARNAQGYIKAIHQIYLDPLTGQKAACAVSQESLGQVTGSYVTLQRGEGAVSVIQNLEEALKLQSNGLPGDIYVALTPDNMVALASFLKDPSLKDPRRPVHLYGEITDPVLHESVEKLQSQGFTAKVFALEEPWGQKSFKDLQDKDVQEKGVYSLNESQPLFISLENLKNSTALRTLSGDVREDLAALGSKGNPDGVDLRPASLIQAMASQKAVFTAEELERALMKQRDSNADVRLILHARVAALSGLTGLPCESEAMSQEADLVSRYIAHVLTDPEVQALGPTVKGGAIYTSKTVARTEQNIRQGLQRLQDRPGVALEDGWLVRTLEKVQAQTGLTYSSEQQAALWSFWQPEAVAMMTGQAGTGKTTLLKPLVQAYQAAGYIVLGTSFQGKVADMLSRDLEIDGFTLHQLREKWQQREAIREKVARGDLCPEDGKDLLARSQHYQLTDRHVVIVDEGNMVPDDLWQRLLPEIEFSGARLRIVGDNHQIKSLRGGDLSRLIEDEIGSVCLTEVYRQQVDWMRDATRELNQHRVTAGLAFYRPFLKFHPSAFSARYGLLQDYLAGRHHHPEQSHMMLAFRRDDVADLNEAARVRLKARGALGEEYILVSPATNDVSPGQGLTTLGRTLVVAVGELLKFTVNDHQGRWVQSLEGEGTLFQGVKNGTLGTVTSIEPERQHLEIRLQDGRLIGVDFNRYDALTYAYATTVNQAEGETYDCTYGLYDPIMSANHVLIWASRHRHQFQASVDQERTPDFKALTQSVNKGDYRGLTTDSLPLTAHPESYAVVKQYWDSTQEAHRYRAQALEIEDAVKPKQDKKTLSQVSDLWEKYHEHREIAKGAAHKIVVTWDLCAPFVQQVGLARDTLEVEAGIQAAPLSADQLKASDQVKAYYDLVFELQRRMKEFNQDKKGQSQDLATFYDQACLQRNALAYDMASLPSLYHPLFRVQETKKGFVTVFGAKYLHRPPSFKKMKDHAQEHFDYQVRTIYDRAPDVEGRLALGETLLSKIDLVQDQPGRLSQRLRFEQIWGREKDPACSLETLRVVGDYYDQVSQNIFSPERVHYLCHQLLGVPRDACNTKELRYGQTNNLVISLDAQKAGVWYDFESGDKGTLVSLMQRHQGVSLEAAQLSIIDCLQNASPEFQTRLAVATIPFWDQNRVQTSQTEDAEKQQRRAAIIQHVVPLAGTLADRYLTEHRHLPTARSRDIRYHAPHEGRWVASLVESIQNRGVNELREEKVLPFSFLDTNFHRFSSIRGSVS